MAKLVEERAREFVAQYIRANPFAEIRIGHPDDFYARLTALLTQVQAEARLVALEEAAKVIDQCNREGPYNAIQGASRIRALAQAAAPATKEE